MSGPGDISPLMQAANAFMNRAAQLKQNIAAAGMLGLAAATTALGSEAPSNNHAARATRGQLAVEQSVQKMHKPEIYVAPSPEATTLAQNLHTTFFVDSPEAMRNFEQLAEKASRGATKNADNTFSINLNGEHVVVDPKQVIGFGDRLNRAAENIDPKAS